MTISVFGRDIWFCIRPNLGPFLVTLRSLLASSEVPEVPNFCYYMSGSPVHTYDIFSTGTVLYIMGPVYWHVCF